MASTDLPPDVTPACAVVQAIEKALRSDPVGLTTAVHLHALLGRQLAQMVRDDAQAQLVAQKRANREEMAGRKVP